MKYTNAILTVIAGLLAILCLQNSGSSIFPTAKAAPAPLPAPGLTKVVLCDERGKPLGLWSAAGDVHVLRVIPQKY